MYLVDTPLDNVCPWGLIDDMALHRGDDIFNHCSVIMNSTKVVAREGKKATKKVQLNSKGISQGIELAYGLYFNWFACLKTR